MMSIEVEVKMDPLQSSTDCFRSVEVEKCDLKFSVLFSSYCIFV